MIVVPTAAELAESNDAFDRDWGGVDDVLYELCRRHSDHGDRRSTTAKVALIERAYSAGLERRGSPPKGQQAIAVIADRFELRGAEIAKILAPLREVDDNYPSVVRFCRDLDAQATPVKTFSTTRPGALRASDRPPRAVDVTLPVGRQSS